MLMHLATVGEHVSDACVRTAGDALKPVSGSFSFMTLSPGLRVSVWNTYIQARPTTFVLELAQQSTDRKSVV